MAFSQFNQSIPRSRRSPGAYILGVWTPGGVIADTIEASVQPASRDDLKLLPEGRRVEGAYSIRSTAEIRAEDVLTLYGVAHEVIATERWGNAVLPHWLGLAQRVIQ